MEQCQVQAFPLCLPLHSGPLMVSFTGQKDGLKCWFNVGPIMEPWNSAFPSWNVFLTQLRYRLRWAMSWVSKSCERAVTLSQDHQLHCSHGWCWGDGQCSWSVTAVPWEIPSWSLLRGHCNAFLHVWKQGHCLSRVGTRGLPCPSPRLGQCKNKESFRI